MANVFVPDEEQYKQLQLNVDVLMDDKRAREDRKERVMEPEEMVDAAIAFYNSSYGELVREAFCKYRYSGVYVASDEDTRIYDILRFTTSPAVANEFRNAYAGLHAVVTRLLMHTYPWGRPPTNKNERQVTKIRSCKADRVLIERDPMGYAWLKEWCDRCNAEAAKRLARKKAASESS